MLPSLYTSEMDVFSKLGFEKLTESVLGKRGSSGKAFCYGSIFL